MSALYARRYYVRGSEELKKGALDDALQDFQAAIQLAPGFYEARIGYATTLLKMNDPPRAAQTLRVGLAQAVGRGERFALLRTLGDALIASGDFFGAEDALFEATQLGVADSADLHDRLARVRARTGRLGDAFDELLRAARLS